MLARPILSTGDVARALGVSTHTVANQVDKHEIPGFKIPMSHHRRVDVRACVEQFERAGETYTAQRLSELLIGKTLVLTDREKVMEDVAAQLDPDRYVLRMVGSTFELGLVIQEWRPDVVVVDLYDEQRVRAVQDQVVVWSVMKDTSLSVISLYDGTQKAEKNGSIHEQAPRLTSPKDLARMIERHTARFKKLDV